MTWAGVAVVFLVFVLVVLTSPLAGIGVFFAEWMLALLLIPIAVTYRVVFHRPWRLSAASADGRDLLAAEAEGWSRSAHDRHSRRASTDVRHRAAGLDQADA